MDNIPLHCSPVISLAPVIRSLNTLWLRDERELHWVSPTARFLEAVFNNPAIYNTYDAQTVVNIL